MRKSDKKVNIQKVNLIIESRFNLLKEGTLDGKYSTKRSITNALYDILKINKIEGRYTDEYWEGINKLTTVLKVSGIDFELVSAKYEHNNDEIKTRLPNSKVYVFDVKVMDKMGREQVLPLKVTCAFVGTSGTMEDKTYELTYYFMV
jgi:hypothetical protein